MAIFFQFSTTNDVIVVEELVLRKYNMDYVKKMSLSHGMKFIEKCFEKETEEILWPMYISDRERMSEDSFVSFSKYIEDFIKPKIIVEKTENMLDEIEGIKKEMEDENGSI